MLPTPFPPIKAARPLILLGLAATAAAVAVWARQKAKQTTRKPTRIRIEPLERIECLEVPWGTEVR